MVRETGRLSKTPLPIVAFFCSAFFSNYFKLECGKGSVFVIPYVVFRRSAGLLRTN